MVVLVMMLIAVGVVMVVMRSAAAQSGPSPTRRPTGPSRRPRAARPLAPDDDPEFLRELGRRAARGDGTVS